MHARALQPLLALAPLLAACARQPATETDAGPPAPEPTASASPELVLEAPATTRAAFGADFQFAPTEARRARIAHFADVPALKANPALLATHFGTPPPAHALVESVELSGGRTAWLVSADDPGKSPKGDAPDAHPLVLLVGPDGRRIWSKERPLGGVMPPVTRVTILPGSQNGVALALFDAPTHAVALRLWDGDGGVLVDFQLFEIEDCDALSALYWPGRGWIAFAVWSGGSRAQLIREDGTMSWGREAPPLGVANPVGAASLVLDTDESFVVVQRGTPGGAPKNAPPHLYAWRYDTKARPMWDRPADLGVAPPGRDHPVVSRAGERRVRVAPGAGAPTLDVTSDGAVLRR